MIYKVIKWITGIALHWFYRDIRIVGRDLIPVRGPLLVAVNHQNALVDSLIAGWVIPRRIAMTAKATLVDNPSIAFLFRILNVVPLRRASDEVNKAGMNGVDRARNAGAFREILSLLARGGAVLIFPEGKSHNEAGLEPLKSGMARLALQARDEWKVRGVQILPLGLVFEDKGAPGTVVGARVGTPISVDDWAGHDPASLTEEIASRLRAVSESAGLPAETTAVEHLTTDPIREGLIAISAWWGRLTHQYPIRVARAVAIKRSTNADEPAMFTILFGLAFVLVTYVVHLAIVGLVAHSFVVVLLYLVLLVTGAYWAAFEQHPRRY
ncbi:MAG TPA: 1-acyl-sn-glycerol-3-phosphate acyltransferase [Gemmatimonadaceae bacterium]|nr:1-acyl-sn-glycerol-3-phosphate acyltransferase [Gemmatimonadaceae bacterium]